MSLILTRTQPLRAKYSGELDKNEYRRSRYGAFDAFLMDTNSVQSIISPEVKAYAADSFGKTVAIPVIDADDVSISNVRSCTWAKSENTSKLVELNFATVSFGFRMYPAQHANNDVSYQADFNKKLEKYLLKLAAHLDSLAYSTMNANKNSVWPEDITAIYPQVGDALQVGTAEYDDFYNKIAAIMESFDFYGTQQVVANTLHQPIVRKYVNQGAGNGTNTAFQFAGFEFFYSNRIQNRTEGDTLAKSTLFVAPQGTFGFLNRNDSDSRMGNTAGDGTKWEEVVMPIVNLTMGSTYKSYCSDVANAFKEGETIPENVAGLTASMVEEFSFHTDICFLTAYNSAPDEKVSPIVKAEFVAPVPEPET